MQPSHPFRPADLVLTCGNDWHSGLNKAGQSIATLKLARFTHIAICVLPDVLLDARPFAHIQLRNVFTEVRQKRLNSLPASKSDILVLRNAALSDSFDTMDATMAELSGPLYAQLSKKYNWLFLRRQSSDTDLNKDESKRAFCSELCVLMLRHLKALPDTTRFPSRALPVHFQDFENQGWSDVTDEWSKGLQDIEQAIDDPTSNLGKFLLKREEMADSWIQETVGWWKISRDMGAIAERAITDLDDLIARWKLRP
jgi:hypothetical protein